MPTTKKKIDVKVAAKKPAQRSSTLPVTIVKKQNSGVSKPVKNEVSKPMKTKRSVSLLPDSVATAPKGKVAKRNTLPGLTEERMRVICGRISNGEAAYRVLKSESIDTGDFYCKLHNNELYAKMYRDAMERRGEKFADELTELADEARHGTHEDIQALKLMVNTRQWIVSRLLPKKYGDKVTVAGDAENPLVTQLVVSGGDLVKRIKGGD